MNCTRCGRALDADSRFCEGCGTPVTASPPSPTPPGPPPASSPPPPVSPRMRVEPPQPGPADTQTGRSRLLIPLVVAGCGCLLVLMLAGGLGLWWWLDREGGFELPNLSGPPTPSPSTSVPESVASTPPDDVASPAPEVPSEPSPPTAAPPATPSEPPARDPDEVEWGPQAEIPVILFMDQADVNGDGRVEQVQIVSSDGNGDPTTSTPRRFRVVDDAGKTLFQTDDFTEPFLPELDHLADHPANHAGIHVVKGSGRWPDIRIVFAPASGNFVVFRFDGSTYRAVEAGD